MRSASGWSQCRWCVEAYTSNWHLLILHWCIFPHGMLTGSGCQFSSNSAMVTFVLKFTLKHTQHDMFCDKVHCVLNDKAKTKCQISMINNVICLLKYVISDFRLVSVNYLLFSIFSNIVFIQLYVINIGNFNMGIIIPLKHKMVHSMSFLGL